VAGHPGEIGPVIENGFYYDFFRNEPFTPEDFAAIEKKMREIVARDKPFTKEIWTANRPSSVRRQRRDVQGRAGRRSRPTRPLDLQAGRLVRSAPRTHMTSTGKIGNAFKLMKSRAPIGAATATIRC
jgi:threonyl-tRNA synthetase